MPENPERMIDPRPGRPRVIQCADYVDPNGLMYVTDSNAGLHILQFEGSWCSPARRAACIANES